MISEQEMQDLAEIRRLLDEAYDHYFKFSDGYCKSSEGHIGLDFNNYFNRQEGQSFGIKTVEVYSYVLGPNRNHAFGSTAEALEIVRGWHDKEMQEDYEEDFEQHLPDYSFQIYNDNTNWGV
ncbi:hypothetical protein ABZ353_10935 [Streptomyces niveus]|uniref:hypothetical protein n=1 Tax=Streptomyces niveus TaxID=193462 RepID=UPI0033DAD222